MVTDRMTSRRSFITLLGGAAVARPLGAHAQHGAMPVVAFFSAGSPSTFGHLAAAFREGLRELGYVEGRDITIDDIWGENQFDRLPTMAASLVQRRVAVIAASPRAVNAAKAATATIPIVFMSGSDPVRTGLVTSLSRPDGNLTGVTILAADLTVKRFRLLHDPVPAASVIGVLSDSTNPEADYVVQEVQAAARSNGVQTHVASAVTETQLEAAFETFSRERAGAVFVNNGFLFFSVFREQLASLAARYRLPASYELREHVTAGGLMSYGPSLTQAFRQVGRYTGRILKGDKPSELPVMLPTTFEFVINFKTAATLGLAVPAGVLAIADEVIE
jgi:ABC-type uncharacterized transport system substrate-binding protein